MKLQELFDVLACEIPAGTLFYRVQRARSRRGSLSIGPFRLPPAGSCSGRFDLPHQAVGYAAESPVTAILETIARREATDVSLSGVIALRRLLALQIGQPLRLADLRPHASSWPVLQSQRLNVTQQIAADASRLGFDGLVYRSAQHYGHDCYALFQPVLGQLKLLWRKPLLDPSGGLHRALLTALHGSQVPLVP